MEAGKTAAAVPVREREGTGLTGRGQEREGGETDRTGRGHEREGHETDMTVSVPERKNGERMIPEYRRTVTQSFMILRSPGNDGADTFDTRMLILNPLNGVMRLTTEILDDETLYLYETTGYAPLISAVTEDGISAGGLQRIFENLLDTLLHFEDYLLDADRLLLDPDFLWYDSRHRQILAPYVPFRKQNVRRSMTELAQYFLMKCGSGDRESQIMLCRIMHELQESGTQLIGIRTLLAEWEVIPEKRGQGKRNLKERRPDSPGSSGEALPGRQTPELSFCDAGPGRQSGSVRAGTGENEEDRNSKKRKYGSEEGEDRPWCSAADADPEEVRKMFAEAENGAAVKHGHDGFGETADMSGRDFGERTARRASAVLPERGTVRTACIAAFPAAAVYAAMELQSRYYFTPAETAGAVLGTVSCVLLFRIIRKKHGK